MERTNPHWKHAIGIFLVIVALRLPSLWTPLFDTDESFFAAYANDLLAGGIPYVTSLDTKPVGLYYFFALIFSLFGKNNMIAVHAATTIIVALTAWYAYRITRLFHSERAGLLAALFYGIFTTTYIPKYISTSFVIVMMLPLTMSVYYLLAYEQRKSAWRMLLAGILFGAASLIKYQAGITIVAVAFYYLFFAPLRSWRFTLRDNVLPFALYAAGGCAVGILFALYLLSLGVWDEFLFWSVKGSAAYIDAGSQLAQFAKNLLTRGGSFVASTFLLWYFGVRRLLDMGRDLFKPIPGGARGMVAYIIPVWFLFNIVPVCTGGRFYGHYFIQLLPPLAILASVRADRFLAWRSESGNLRRKRIAYALFLAGLILPALGFFGARLFYERIYEATGEEDLNAYRPIAAYIEARTHPDDKIFVWGFATPIYTYSNRDAGARFLICDWLTGRTPGTKAAKDPSFDTTQHITPGSWDMFFEDIEKSTPVYFVDTSPGNHHDYGKYPVSKFPALKRFLDEHYALEASVDGADIYRRIP